MPTYRHPYDNSYVLWCQSIVSKKNENSLAYRLDSKAFYTPK